MGLPELFFQVTGDTGSAKDMLYGQRKLPDGDLYFISHLGDKKISADLNIKWNGKQPEWWDAVRGTSRTLTDYTVTDGRIVIPVELYPRESGFVVMREQPY